MLGMKTYSQDYIDACRARVEANLRAYRKQVGKTPAKAFEDRFFKDQVLLLDYMFVHPLSAIEARAANPLNEARVLCHSILLHTGKLQIDSLQGGPHPAAPGPHLPPATSP